MYTRSRVAVYGVVAVRMTSLPCALRGKGTSGDPVVLGGVWYSLVRTNVRGVAIGSGCGVRREHRSCTADATSTPRHAGISAPTPMFTSAGHVQVDNG